MNRTLPALALLLASAVPVVAQDSPRGGPSDGVFNTYRELLEVLDGRRPAAAPSEDERPSEYVIHGVRIRGRAGERVAQFEATFDIEATGRWVVVPIGLGEASLESAEGLDGRPVVGPLSVLTAGLDPKARAALGTRGFGMLLEKGGRVEATVRFALPIRSEPGESRVSLTLPSAALVQLDATLPQPGLRVAVGGALAVDPVGGTQAETSIRAFFAAGAQARITWNPRPKATDDTGPALEPLLFAEAHTRLELEEGVLQAQARVDYRIHQAACDTFKVRFPSGYTLLAVEAPGLRAYPIPVSTPEGQELTVALRGKVSGRFSMTLRLERVLREGDREVEFPRVVTLGTERESGTLVAVASQFLNLEPANQSGLSQVDANKVTLERGDSDRQRLVFRYQKQPYALALRTSPIEAQVEGRLHTLAVVKTDEVALATAATYTITKRGIFGVRLRLPAGYQLLECGDPGLIKDHRIEAASEEERASGLGDVLVVDFVGQRGPGVVNLRIYGLLRRTPQPETGSARVEIPRLRMLDVDKESGILAVGAQQQLKLSLEKKSSLLPLAVGDLSPQGFPHGVNRGEEVVVGFRYAKPEGVFAAFTVQRRDPKVTASVETLVDAQEDRVRVETSVHYTVRYAGVTQVRLETDGDLAAPGVLKFDRDRVKDVSSQVADGKAVWTVSLQGSRIGTFPLRFSYDIKLNDFSAGHQRQVTLRTVKVLDCFSETGDIALKKHDNVVIDEFDREGLEKRDTRDLPSTLRKDGVVQAYRYVAHPFRLIVRVIKYDFRAPLGIQIKHLHQDEVVRADGVVQAEATLALVNDSEQSLSVVLPAGAKLEGHRIKVDGRNVNPSTSPGPGGRPVLLIHLGEITQKRRGQPFQIRIRYDVPSAGALSGTGRVTLEPLQFPLAKVAAEDASGVRARVDAIPVERMTRGLYLPHGFYYLDFETPAAKLFQESGLWSGLKQLLGVPSDRDRTQVWRGVEASVQAVAELKSMAEAPADGLTRPLALPSSPYLLESQGAAVGVSVRYVASWLYTVASLLVVIGVLAAAFALDRKKLLGPVAISAALAGLSVAGAVLFGSSLEPFFAAGFVGSLGIGVIFLVRGIGRELTTGMQRRQQERAERQAQVAKARAQAAEAEASLRAATASAE